MDFQAIILGCDDPRQLHPFTRDGASECLLSLTTRPLLWYPLRALNKANVENVLLVLRDTPSVPNVKSWLSKETKLPPCEILTVDEGASVAEAMRVCLPRISSSRVMVLRLKVISDLPLRTVLMHHCVQGTAATVVLRKRLSSASSQTKAGKAPKGVDYVGLDEDRKRLLFFHSSKEVMKTIRLSASVLRKYPKINITTDFLDSGIYVLSREALAMFAENLSWTEISTHLLPNLIKDECLREAAGQITQGSLELRDEVEDGHASQGVSVFFPKADEYVAMVSTPQAFADVHKELMRVHLRTSLVELPESKQENLLQPTVELGNKATVTGSCLVCDGTSLADNVAVKRSFIGRNCRIGASCRIINSVVLDEAVLEDHCHVQNCVLGANSRIGRAAQMKDTMIGPNVSVAENSELNEDVLPEAH